MTIKDALKQVEDKLEAELKQPKTFTMPLWVWALIGVVSAVLAILVLRG